MLFVYNRRVCYVRYINLMLINTTSFASYVFIDQMYDLFEFLNRVYFNYFTFKTTHLAKCYN